MKFVEIRTNGDKGVSNADREGQMNANFTSSIAWVCCASGNVFSYTDFTIEKGNGKKAHFSCNTVDSTEKTRTKSEKCFGQFFSGSNYRAVSLSSSSFVRGFLLRYWHRATWVAAIMILHLIGTI